MPLHPSSREQLLHRAIRAGNTAEAEAHAVLLEVGDAEQRNVTLHRAAVHYATLGLHVFPLQPGSKIPYKGSRGCKDATSDTRQIYAWWTTRPTSNIGLATGHLIDVIDIDGAPGIASWVDLYDTLPPRLGVASTPRPGGTHLYIPAVEGRGNKAGIAAGVDYRGTSGYVVAPPSTTEQGAYMWRMPLELPSLKVTV